MWGYVGIEVELTDLEGKVPTYAKEAFESTSRLLFADIFSDVDQQIYEMAVEPRHGPGGTANGLRGNQKFRQLTWTDRLESIFPYGEFCLPSWRYHYLQDDVQFLAPEQEIPVKVIPVPKTLRGPRIIAEEPVWMQYMQQAILRPLVRALEDPEELVSGFLGFSDQIPNREMARRGSQDGSLATLDLSEASDRVPHWLVMSMLSNHPWLKAAVEATRSTRAEIPTIGVAIPNLKKFASMGSALCFPFEAMTFLVVVLNGIIAHYEREERRVLLSSPARTKFIESLVGKVRVYGDDIIVPVDCVDSVVTELETFGFKVNVTKSFWNGKFRESCGGDFYDGVDVTPIRLKHEIPTSRKDGSAVASFVEFRNHVFSRGLLETAEWCDNVLTQKKLLGEHFPVVAPTSPCLGRWSHSPWEAEKIDERTHAPMVKGYVLQPRIPSNKIDGEWALVKCLANPRLFEDTRHLDRSGRSSAVDTKLRWVTPF
jgi:hypothetical protein